MTVDPHILEQARSADPDARQKAALVVAQTTGQRDLPLMFELLGDRDWRVRKTIVDGFVRDANPQIVKGLMDALADPENARLAQGVGDDVEGVFVLRNEGVERRTVAIVGVGQVVDAVGVAPIQ